MRVLRRSVERMSWLRIDDNFVEHPKVLDLSDRAFRLHMAGLCFCARNLTDGVLVARAVKTVCAITGANRRHLVELRDVGLWDERADGYAIRDYLDYNFDRESIKALREKRADAGRKGGIRSGEARRSKTEAFGSSKRASTGVEPHPIPSPVKTKGLSGPGQHLRSIPDAS